MAEIETTNTTETQATEEVVNETQATPEPDNAEIAKLRAQLAQQKAALDKATKEAAENKRALRAKQTAEEQAAEIEKERQEAIEKELNELRRERAVANTSKRVFTFVPDETASTEIATALYGAEDVDAAISLIQKAWTAREKALRAEYGKIPAPSVGASDGPAMTREQLLGMRVADIAEFQREHPDEYNKLMGH